MENIFRKSFDNITSADIQNLINIPSDDKVMAFINTKDLKDEEYINSNYIVMCTKKGKIKKTTLEAYSRPRTNGINAITIREDDQLLEAKMTNGSSQIMLAVKSGKAIQNLHTINKSDYIWKFAKEFK